MTNLARQDVAATLLAEARTPVGLLVLGWLGLFGPIYYNLATTVWASDEQGHGPIILAVCVWLLWRRRE